MRSVRTRLTRAGEQAADPRPTDRQRGKSLRRARLPAASVDEIAEDAGFSKGAVYANFPTKEQLFLAVMNRQQKLQEQSFQAMADPEKPSADAMAELAEVAAPTDPEAWRFGLLTLEFFLYAVRQPELRAELAERSRSPGNSSPPPSSHTAPLRRSRHGLPPTSRSSPLRPATASVQAVLDHTAIPPDLYQRMMAKLLG